MSNRSPCRLQVFGLSTASFMSQWWLRIQTIAARVTRRPSCAIAWRKPKKPPASPVPFYTRPKPASRFMNAWAIALSRDLRSTWNLINSSGLFLTFRRRRNKRCSGFEGGHMKSWLCVFTLLLCTAPAFAQAPPEEDLLHELGMGGTFAFGNLAVRDLQRGLDPVQQFK